jgi:hypothetical protein
MVGSLPSPPNVLADVASAVADQPTSRQIEIRTYTKSQCFAHSFQFFWNLPYHLFANSDFYRCFPSVVLSRGTKFAD